MRGGKKRQLTQESNFKATGTPEKLKIELQTTDHRGKPAAGEVAVMLVDALSEAGIEASKKMHRHRQQHSRATTARPNIYKQQRMRSCQASSV